MQRLMLEAYKFGTAPAFERSTRNAGKRKKAPLKKRTATAVAKENDGEKAEGEDGADQEGAENPEGESSAPKKKRKSGFSSKPAVLSESLAGLLGDSLLARTEVVKRLHAYIKEHSLQSPKDKRKIIFDQRLQEVFKCKGTDYFKFNRLISQHVKPADEVVS